MKEFDALRAKHYSYLKDNNDEDKITKGTKTCVIKRKLKSEDYRNYLEVSEIERKTNLLEKNKINVNSLKDQKEFIKNNKLILKHNKYLKVKGTMFLLEKLARLL